MESETGRKFREILEMFDIDPSQKKGQYTIIGHLMGTTKNYEELYKVYKSQGKTYVSSFMEALGDEKLSEETWKKIAAANKIALDGF